MVPGLGALGELITNLTSIIWGIIAGVCVLVMAFVRASADLHDEEKEEMGGIGAGASGGGHGTRGSIELSGDVGVTEDAEEADMMAVIAGASSDAVSKNGDDGSRPTDAIGGGGSAGGHNSVTGSGDGSINPRGETGQNTASGGSQQPQTPSDPGRKTPVEGGNATERQKGANETQMTDRRRKEIAGTRDPEQNKTAQICRICKSRTDISRSEEDPSKCQECGEPLIPPASQDGSVSEEPDEEKTNPDRPIRREPEGESEYRSDEGVDDLMDGDDDSKVARGESDIWDEV